MKHHQLDIITCTDTRYQCRDSVVPWYHRQIKRCLGPLARCFVTNCASNKVGGQMILINHLWGPRCGELRSDFSHLGLLVGLYLQLLEGKILLMSTYWPQKSSAAQPELSGKLWDLTSHYLTEIGNTKTPLQYVQDLSTLWSFNHRKKDPLNTAILMGDFNSGWHTKQGCHRYLVPWAEGNHWANPGMDLLKPEDEDVWTHWEEQGQKPVSTIDHILVSPSSPLEMTGFGTAHGPFWADVSDHRPVMAWFSSPHLRINANMNHKARNGPVKIVRSELSTAPAILASFIKTMNELVLPANPAALSVEAAGQFLLELALHSVKAVPKKGRHNKISRSSYKDGWSPQLVALKAQLRTLLAIRGHLKGHRHYSRWRNPDEIHAGVLELTNTWESLIAAMPWPDKRVDPFVWSIGQSPSTLRTADDLGSTAYAIRVGHDLKLLRRALSGRKRTELRLSSVYYMRVVEQARQEGQLRKVINTVVGSSKEHVPITAVDLRPSNATAATQGTDVTREEVHVMLSEVFEEVHVAPAPSPTSALHDGTLTWAEAQSWEKFKAAFPTLAIKGIPLRTFWEALISPLAELPRHGILRRHFPPLRPGKRSKPLLTGNRARRQGDPLV